jgi:hypothetical protein
MVQACTPSKGRSVIIKLLQDVWGYSLELAEVGCWAQNKEHDSHSSDDGGYRTGLDGVENEFVDQCVGLLPWSLVAILVELRQENEMDKDRRTRNSL